MESKEDLKRGDDYQTEWEQHYDEAMSECMTESDNILMEVEHLVHDLDQTLKVEDVLTLSEAILKVSNLRYYRLSTEVYGKYNTWVEDFDYDFTKQIKDVLQDRLSFELKIGAK
tara:strand:+ start:181 stop:522 length:342 start_codon:yes stop_codon:yes gene_type:complete